MKRLPFAEFVNSKVKEKSDKPTAKARAQQKKGKFKALAKKLAKARGRAFNQAENPMQEAIADAAPEAPQDDGEMIVPAPPKKAKHAAKAQAAKPINLSNGRKVNSMELEMLALLFQVESTEALRGRAQSGSRCD